MRFSLNLPSLEVEAPAVSLHSLLPLDLLRGGDWAEVAEVHGEPGWDEPTPCGPFELYDVRPGRVTRSERDPADDGLARCAPADLAGGDAAHNALGMRAVFAGEDRGPHRDALVLNAALVLEVTGAVPDPRAAIRAANEALDRGEQDSGLGDGYGTDAKKTLDKLFD